MKNYVLIGAGVAAVGAAEGIRSVDKDGVIYMISSEERPAYCRPLISYYLEGRTDPEKMKYRPDSFYPEMKCELVYGRADKIDPDGRCVYIGKRRLPYSELCIATGARPVSLPIPGKEDVVEKFYFMTEDDAKGLKNSLEGGKKSVLILGAGLIGLKCAEGIHGMAGDITVVDLAPGVLSSILDDEPQAIIQRKLEENGIKFILGDSIDRFENNTAVTKGGKRIPFDVFVEAVGVRPDTELVKDMGIVNRGIVTDTAMRTEIEHIYAAGDVAEGYDSSTGANGILALLPNAYMQGYTAGVNMAGGSAVYDDAIPMNAIGFFGLHALTAGRYTGEAFVNKTEKTLKRLFFDGGRLAGFMIVGEDVNGAGIYTSLVRSKTVLTEEQRRELEISPTLSVFDAALRKQKLGGL